MGFEKALHKTLGPTTQINIISIVGFEYVQRVPAWMDVGDDEVGGDLGVCRIFGVGCR